MKNGFYMQNITLISSICCTDIANMLHFQSAPELYIYIILYIPVSHDDESLRQNKAPDIGDRCSRRVDQVVNTNIC